MADMHALRQFIDGLKGERTAASGITGVTSNVQRQTQQLRESFARWYMDKYNAQAKQDFVSNLLLAHTLGVLSDSEFAQCEHYLED